MTECKKVEKTRIRNGSTVYWMTNSKVFHCAPVSPTVVVAFRVFDANCASRFVDFVSVIVVVSPGVVPYLLQASLESLHSRSHRPS